MHPALKSAAMGVHRLLARGGEHAAAVRARAGREIEFQFRFQFQPESARTHTLDLG
jgi:hypothetical protein